MLSVCGDLPTSIPNGEIIEYYKPRLNTNVVDTIIGFKCHYGYKLSINKSEYVCPENGVWNISLSNITCLKGKLVFI